MFVRVHVVLIGIKLNEHNRENKEHNGDKDQA